MKSLTSFVPIARNAEQFSFGDHLGSIAAHQDLLLSALSEDLVPQVNLVEGTHSQQSQGWPSAAALVSGLDSSISEAVKRRIRVFDLASFIQAQAIESSLLLGRIQDFPNFSFLRDQCGADAPICTIVHSVVMPDMIAKWMLIGLTSRPGDVIVVTSCAGDRAIRKLVSYLDLSVRGRVAYNWPEIRSIPLGIDLSLVKSAPDRTQARTVLEIPQNAQVLLYAGRLSEEYKADLETLLVVFSRVAKQNKDAILFVAGHSPNQHYPERLRRSAEAIGLGDRVRVLYNYPRELKKSIFRAADVFVSPVDNIQETFGLTIIEAMAFSLPVVASDWSGYRDLIVNGTTGFLIPTRVDLDSFELSAKMISCAAVPHAEYVSSRGTILDVQALERHLLQLLKDEPLRRRMGEEGQKRVHQSYRLSQTIRRFEELWSQQCLRAKGEKSKIYGNLGSLFAHYASHEAISVKDLWHTNVEAAEVGGQLLGSEDRAVEILRYCMIPRSFNDIEQRFGLGSRQQALRLAKKGVLFRRT